MANWGDGFGGGENRGLSVVLPPGDAQENLTGAVDRRRAEKEEGRDQILGR